MIQVNVTWKDSFGAEIVTGFFVEDGTLPDTAGLITLLNALRAASQAEIVKYSLTLPGDVADLTNGAASAAGSYDRVRDQAVLQFIAPDTGQFSTTTVPCPLDTIFIATGAYAQAEVDPADSLVTAIDTAAQAGGLMVAAGNAVLAFRKGWRKGQKHP